MIRVFWFVIILLGVSVTTQVQNSADAIIINQTFTDNPNELINQAQIKAYNYDFSPFLSTIIGPYTITNMSLTFGIGNDASDTGATSQYLSGFSNFQQTEQHEWKQVRTREFRVLDLSEELSLRLPNLTQGSNVRTASTGFLNILGPVTNTITLTTYDPWAHANPGHNHNVNDPQQDKLILYEEHRTRNYGNTVASAGTYTIPTQFYPFLSNKGNLDYQVYGLSGDSMFTHSILSMTVTASESQVPVPEPATIALLGIGLAGLAGAAVRRKRKTEVGNKIILG